MLPNLCIWQRRHLPALLLVVAMGCGETEAPQASMTGKTTTSDAATSGKLLGAWIVGEDHTSYGNDIASRMKQGIANNSCRFEFRADNQINILQGSGLPIQTGQWRVVGKRESGLSIQISVPKLGDSPEPREFHVVFHDQNHLTMQETSDGSLEFKCTRLLR